MKRSAPQNHIPEDGAAWAAFLLRSILDGWLSAAPDPTGLFHPFLDRGWNRVEGGPLTLVSQCRLIYNFSRGYEVFGEGSFAAAAHRGIEALQTYFRLGPGLYRWAVTGAGEEASAALDSYGHAFVILALATAARAFGNTVLTYQALETWQATSRTFTDGYGGLVWEAGDTAGAARSQNPMMHMFEALMALHSVDITGEAREAAQTLLTFMHSLADFGSGMLVETHTAEWQPQAAERGGVIDLGHAFEWAFLLSEWATVTGDADMLPIGARFLRVGIERGVDDDGGVRASCDQSGRNVSPLKGLWQQCEAIRALSRYAARHASPQADATLQRTLRFYKERFVDTEYGGVFAAPPRLDKGDAWKLDYHTVGMCLELMAREESNDE